MLVEVLSQKEINELIGVAGWAAAAAFGLLVLYFFVRQFLYICRPNEVLVFSGRSYRMADGTVVGSRVEFSGRHWRMPIIERVERLDMTTLPIDIHTAAAYSKGGIPLTVRAIANVKISSDRRHIHNAIERFLGRGREELRSVGKETLEGTLRGVLATLTPEEVNEDRLKFAESLSREVADDFNKLGLHLDILKVQHVTDDKQYLESLGRARIARVIQEAQIAESNADREANQRASEAQSRGQIARHQAEQAVAQKRNDQRRIAAEMDRDVESARREAKARAEQARVQAEQELQTIRRELEQLRLKVDVEIPAEARRRAQELLARGDASPIVENGKALSMVLEMQAKAWADAEPHGREVFLINQLERVTHLIVEKLATLRVKEVQIVDPGDGSALPNYVAGFPNTVTAVLHALRQTTGIDVPSILSSGGNGASTESAPAFMPQGGAR
ncbi:MAG: flotillin family protein [Deltaproteobacteria bacterium]|nr:flotillin family protein [Deltaproteobacteria bacterium]